MKKTIGILLVIVMLFGAIACSDSTASDISNDADASQSSSASSETEDSTKEVTYKLTDTGQSLSYDNDGNVVDPAEGEAYYGQDADYSSYEFSFTDNGDGTVTDNVTGLTWQQIPISETMSWEDAIEYCENLELGGYDDWRLPTAKELFGISDFEIGWPFIDTDYFEFAEASMMGPGGDSSPQGGGPQDGDMPEGEMPEGEMPPQDGEMPEGGPQDGAPQGGGAEGSDKAAGESLADNPPPMETDADSDEISKTQGQFWSANFYYAGTTHGGADTAFGVNHATGHIKGYPSDVSGQMGKYVRAVRGEETAVNDFTDNEDGTVTDEATGLMWMEADAGYAMEWDDALEYAENFEYAGYDDWRLPNVKELQSIVDYTGSYPAIDPEYFTCTELEENENYYFWSSTSAYFSTELPDNAYAWYVAFGKAVGDDGEDSHGAGAVRFSQKYLESEYAGEGGDNILNSVRLVRDTN